jgi:hypothetical protein
VTTKELFSTIAMTIYVLNKRNSMKRKMLVWFDPKKVTCASVGVVETTVVSTLKLFLITYLIVKFVVEPPLIPIEKSLFLTAVFSATTWSYASTFMFWEVR